MEVVFTVAFCFLFGVSRTSARSVARNLNFHFGKAFRFSRRDNTWVAATPLWGVSLWGVPPISAFHEVCTETHFGLAGAQLGARKMLDIPSGENGVLPCQLPYQDSNAHGAGCMNFAPFVADLVEDVSLQSKLIQFLN